jgi:hypothetical protein
MKTENQNTIILRFGIITLMILMAAFSRLLPHPFNFTPLGAMALFGAAYFGNRLLAFIIPLTAMWLSDLVINNTNILINHTQVVNSHSGFEWFGGGFYWMYGSFALITIVGFLLLKKPNVLRVGTAGIFASLIFFLITNFAVWLGSTVYPQNISGLLGCYAAGIPFFGNTLAGDLFYCATLFGIFSLVNKGVRVRAL